MLNTRIKTTETPTPHSLTSLEVDVTGSTDRSPADGLQISMEIRHGSLVRCSALLCLSSDGWPQTQAPTWQDTASELDMQCLLTSYKWKYLHHTWSITYQYVLWITAVLPKLICWSAHNVFPLVSTNPAKRMKTTMGSTSFYFSRMLMHSRLENKCHWHLFCFQYVST